MNEEYLGYHGGYQYSRPGRMTGSNTMFSAETGSGVRFAYCAGCKRQIQAYLLHDGECWNCRSDEPGYVTGRFYRDWLCPKCEGPLDDDACCMECGKEWKV